MSATGGLSKRADAVTNRARLLAVAQAVFAESGLDLEVNDVASRAQLGVGTLYRHFGSREDLLRAIVMQTIEDTQAQISQAIQPYADDPCAALQALISAGLRVQQQYRPLFATMRDRRLTKLLDATQREAVQMRVLEPAQWVIERGIQVGVFRPDLDRDLTAAALLGAITGAFDLLGKSCSLDELEQRLSQLLWTMLTK